MIPKKVGKTGIPSAADLLRFAEEVCKEYRAKGYAITLRQLYYQGVARKFLPSGVKAYDALKDALAKARLEGTFPLWAIVDRTREVYSGRTTRADDSVPNALRRSAEEARLSPERLLHRDRWLAQPEHVLVLFEKEALAGIFEGACSKLGVGWFSCRGDPSHAALYDLMKVMAAAHGVDNPSGWRDRAGNFHKGLAKRTVVLYFGDHDPTGMRIPRSAEETLRTFRRIAGLTFPVEFRRVGLSIEQARELDLPPFPAKQSAGKDFDDYVAEFGTEEAWELDALPPETLESMVEEAVRGLFDADLHARLQSGIEGRRAQMRVEMRSPDWHASATAPIED